MQPNTPCLRCLPHRALLLLSFMALAPLGCMDSASVPCASGQSFCPATMRCTADGTGCINLTDSCGDGVTGPGEACDDGNLRDKDGCNHSCTSTETHGNNFVDPGERCDDGNAVSGDGCSADFLSDETCGNGYIDTVKREKCDDGNTASGDGCSQDCKSREFCGNGYTDDVRGEQCDDGNTVSGDGCSADCFSDETCGNGHPDLTKGEQCDDGNHTSGDGCSADCLSNERCGNNYRDANEACDDGNNTNGDECAADCLVAGRGCGNGRVDPGEFCDDGDTSDLNDCLSTCQPARCGDGIVSSASSLHEQCDSGTERQSSTCDADCTWQLCGDGFVNGDAGEQCDPGAPNTDTAECTHECRVSSCGDRYVNFQAGELCDDGNADSCGTCSATCRGEMPPAAALGFIDAASEWQLRDGETFTLDDGLHSPVTFEFSASGFLRDPRHVMVLRQGSGPTMTQAITDAIMAHQDEVNIEATRDDRPGEPDRVLLLHSYPTSLGNRPVINGTSSRDFFVQGMAGGNAGNCGRRTGCTSPADCAPGLSCSSGTCQ